MNVDPGVLLITVAAFVVFIFVLNALAGGRRSSTSRYRNRFPGNRPSQGLGFTSTSFDSSDNTPYQSSPDPLRTFVAAELIHQTLEHHHHATHGTVDHLQQLLSDSTPSFGDLPPVEAETSYDSLPDVESSSYDDSSSSFDSSSSDSSSSFDSGSSDSSSNDCSSSSSDS